MIAQNESRGGRFRELNDCKHITALLAECRLGFFCYTLIKLLQALNWEIDTGYLVSDHPWGRHLLP